jgi:predicted 2-oxoglutarate/Fe(II)-dependent dioxygenase YbiX
MIVQENYFTTDFCQDYIDIAPKNVGLSWDERAVSLPKDDRVVVMVKDLFKNHNIDLEIDSAQIQTWPTGSKSDLHVHGDGCDWDDGRNNTKFNSMIYLNDDFEGGEFFTENIIIKPRTGTLTLFDGSIVHHGVKPILNGVRYTIILWWKK